MEKNKPVIVPGALITDTSYVNQPQGTVSFALNATNETDEGDRGTRTTEESNTPCYILPVNFIPVADVYIGDNEKLLFLVSAQGNTKFAIIDTECQLTVIFDDTSQVKKMGLSVDHQFVPTYRLIKGCEKIVYWTDNNKKPRTFNISKPNLFKTLGLWDIDKFNLFREYNKIPNFSSVKVINSGGQIEPGSINIAVRYLDAGLNPTEWVTTSKVVQIYNDLSTEGYENINGSINSDINYIDFPTTSKSIYVELETLDKTFPFYQLGFAEAISGNGSITHVRYSEFIPTSKNYFIYTGQNFVDTGVEAEILFITDLITRAKSIEQLENRLELAGTKGSKINFCMLQKYASSIKADMITKRVILNNVNAEGNPKSPTHQFDGLGYMPGEIYSFGIVWVFTGGILSPTYHIPGKNPNIFEGTIYSPQASAGSPIVFPMKSAGNSTINSTYIDANSCEVDSKYWGLDSEGETLLGKPIRHHRFPLRTEVDKPLVESSYNAEQIFNYYNLKISIVGTLKTPVFCEVDDRDCIPQKAVPFQIRVSYKVEGLDYFFVVNIEPNLYSTDTPSYELTLQDFSQYHSSDAFTNIVIEETNLQDVYQPAYSQSNIYFIGDPPVYSTETTIFNSTLQGKLYQSDMFGIKFSGITKPSLEDTNGEEVIGYYIVRNERTDFEKTILDSAVLTPSLVNSKYISHGLLNPEIENDKISKNVFGLIYPDNKFLNKEHTAFDEIIQQGTFTVRETKKGKINYNDVAEGSSFNSKTQKEGNDDGHGADGSPRSRGLDGWSLDIISRDNILDFEAKNDFTIPKESVKEHFYLDGLGSREINENVNVVYNISTDNKIGILQMETDDLVTDKLPYVVLKRSLIDNYSNFRLLPYYKDNENLLTFETEECSIFGGDSYIAPMRYVNTMFWDNRVAKRKGKSNALNIFLGALAIIGGVVLSVVTFGVGAVAGALIVSAGVAVIGGGVLILNAGLKAENVQRAYLEEYDKGLRQTALDNWVKSFYQYQSNIPFNFTGNGGTGNDGPADDTIQWIGDCLTDLWFETSININLRNKMVSNETPTFLTAPGKIESGNNNRINTWEFRGYNYTYSNSIRYPISKLERHLASKLLAFDAEKNDNKFYLGAALGEYYHINPDYLRYNKQKIYYHLALEYDCCSDCQEDFPHRISWSEQSFQEELTDNYKLFLPNNYKDMEGETGKITDLFRFKDKLYFHTEDAFWVIPNSIQERTTQEGVLTFLGSGDFLSMPAKKIVDDQNSSAGNVHTVARLKTKYGVLFPCHKEKKWYLFDGQQLEPISDAGNSAWFKENMRFLMAEQFYTDNNKIYPYFDNPTNPIGIGYLTTYDSKKERLIVTKKDFKILDNLGINYELCNEGAETIIFNSVTTTIANKVAQGFTFLGIENCKLKFQKQEIKIVLEPRNIIETIANNTDIVVQFDSSGSFGVEGVANVKTTMLAWFTQFKTANPTYEGRLIYNLATQGCNGQSWLRILKWMQNNHQMFFVDNSVDPLIGIETPITSFSQISKNIIIISTVNEAAIGECSGQGEYHVTNIINPTPGPSTQYLIDFNDYFTRYDSLIADNYNIKALQYPIVYSHITQLQTQGMLQSSISAIVGETLSAAEITFLTTNPNLFVPAPKYATLLLALAGFNPYPKSIPTINKPIPRTLRQIGWQYKHTRGWNGTEDIIPLAQFQNDIQEFLQSSTQETTVIVPIEKLVTIIEYIEGEPIVLNTIDNSWTMSYSLKDKQWIGWHSYLPSYYIHFQELFFSWKNNLMRIYKHNAKNSYRIFYGEEHPFIIEFVDNTSPTQTKIWDGITYQAEAKKFSADYEEFVNADGITFNKIIVYNSRQSSGELIVKTKDLRENYLSEQTLNTVSTITAELTEKDWSINELRDIKINYSLPSFIKKLENLQDKYYIDKVVNPASINPNKDWTEMESFRDKFLVIRLIFDTFTDVKLTTNFFLPDAKVSEK
jgi:hypothetical protein